MRVEKSILPLQQIADCVRILCGYECACIVLRDDNIEDICNMPQRSHGQIRPYLSFCRPFSRYYGTITDSRLLQHERVLAYCDMVLQTGDLWLLDLAALFGAEAEDRDVADTPASLLAIAPLMGENDLIGWLLCSTTTAYETEECGFACLLQCLPRISQLVCAALTDGAPAPAVPAVPDYDALLSMIGHDLRAPLGVIKGYAGLLQAYGSPAPEETAHLTLTDTLAEKSTATELTPASRQRYLRVIMEQIDHLEVLIRDLLDISYLRAGHLRLNPSWIALGELCQKTTQQMQDRIAQQEAGHYRIDCLVDPDLPPVLADRHRVQQVLMNLLENAMKYSPDGGLIEILVQTVPSTLPQCMDDAGCEQLLSSTMVAVTIRDHGIGISQRQQSTLFQPFRRLPQSLASPIPGSGLGLYISRRLLEAMHGHITLRSREGHGTSVTFFLPASSPSPAVLSVREYATSV